MSSLSSKENHSSRFGPQVITMSVLQESFRLPPIIRELIKSVYYEDNITLTGPDTNAFAQPSQSSKNRLSEFASNHSNQETIWRIPWLDPIGLYWFAHDEQESKQTNRLEVSLIKELFIHGLPQPAGSVAIITPHRAQRTLLRTELAQWFGENRPIDLIDTVERLQGGERPTIIVSATVSDPVAITQNAEFILDLNRANVAFSRAKQRLIVIASKRLIEHISGDYSQYQNSILWKGLRLLCQKNIISCTAHNHKIDLFSTDSQ